MSDFGVGHDQTDVASVGAENTRYAAGTASRCAGRPMSHRRWILPDRALSSCRLRCHAFLRERNCHARLHSDRRAGVRGRQPSCACWKPLGYLVVEEAATDVIAMENALGLRRAVGGALASSTRSSPCSGSDSERALADRDGDRDWETVFFDRSPVCTLALSRLPGLSPRRIFSLARLKASCRTGSYDKTVFFIRNQGSVQATAARRISFADSLTFERVHEETYRDLGFRLLVDIPPGPLPDRVALIERALEVCP